MNNSNFDNGIPELTEVVSATVITPATATPAPPVIAQPVIPAPVTHTTDAASEAADAPEPPAFLLATPPVPGPAPAPSTSHALSDWTDAEWHRLESDIRERIARQVLGRIDFVLEQRVRDSLADVLQVAVEGLATEIKRGLHQTLEEVISRAVAQEITRLKTTKN